ncbi:hypothetical protein WMF11_49020 [Sorangium sp. So ce295]|uniref:hypothetical protein n=1 Tax=Sorangium sp. So ce295 TaxID=3133295 RepID=UPI003F60AA79
MASLCPRMVALVAASLATTACIGAELDEESEELVEVDESALVAGNGMIPNALRPNGLSPNGLSPNGLSPNGLSPNGLSPNSLSPTAWSAIRNPGTSGSLSRELLRYVVGCALRPDQSFAFSWTDSDGVVHPETYRGELGLAFWWAFSPLNDTYVQRQLTACLAARTNWYGVSVMVSLRNNELGSVMAERTTYGVREGAFWGNVFSATPYLQACYSPSGVTRARQMQRDCAAGHVNVDPVTGATTVQQCGPIVIAGSCDTLCNSVDSTTGAYRGCIYDAAVSPSVRTDQVITSFLPP